MKPSSSSHWDFEVRLLAWLAVCVSVFSFLYYFRRGEVMLYGDAVAHINIARRVFDSKTPGLLQLGTVWLPLPHLLMIPFLISKSLWQSGAGGSIPSMVAYVFGVVGIFRLVRGALSNSESPNTARAAAWLAALAYGANPNLIYMQATAMGESLYLALFIWAVAYFTEFVRGDHKALTKCGLCLAAACWTRYDGWFLAVAVAACSIMWVSWSHRANRTESGKGLPIGGLVKFLLIAAAAPVLWLAYNAIVYHNALEFENGPYSAKGIEKATQSTYSPGHPGSGNLLTSGLYFLKACQGNIAGNEWLQRLWVLLLVAAMVSVLLFALRKTPGEKNQQSAFWIALALLLVPLPFYALSVAYGGVPIFIPPWWPFSHYNVRYGLQLLPAFAVALAYMAFLALQHFPKQSMQRRGAIVALLGLIAASYSTIWKAKPICYAEAAINMRTRNTLEKQVAGWLKALPPDATLLMYLGGHPGAVQQAGIPLKHVINEGNHRVWMQPADPEGLWERALANPAQFADYALTFEGDSVWQAVQGRHLKELVEIKVTDQPRAILFRLR